MSNERSCQCGQAQRACTTEFQYAVKLVCGVVSPSPAGGAPTPVAPGRYWTAINIHNPDKCHEAHLRWKVVVAAPLGQTPAVPVYQRPSVLGPDLALEIDCRRVMQTFPPPVPTFVKGYVVIESDIELDVVAIYSGTQGGNTQLSSFHTERVQPRCVPVCEDLVLPLHTGVAAWQTVAPTPGQHGPVALVSPIPWTTPPPFGSSWVSQFSTDGGPGAPTNRRYELCFDLCFGFTPPAPFQIQLLTDGYPSQVYLNGPPQIGVVGMSGWTTPTIINVPPNRFRAGRNCFWVDVPNQDPSPNPTGFALAGILRVIRGKCPCSPLPIAARSPGAATFEAQSVEPAVTPPVKTVAKRRKKRGS